MKDKKLPLVSLLSTILIGGYTIVLLCVGIVTIFLGRYAGGLVTCRHEPDSKLRWKRRLYKRLSYASRISFSVTRGNDRHCSVFAGSRDVSVVFAFPDPFDIFHRNVEKKENKSGRLCENNYFLYSFDSFLAAASKCTDNPAADNSSNYGTDRVDKEKRN